jgi:hypothetical protein
MWQALKEENVKMKVENAQMKEQIENLYKNVTESRDNDDEEGDDEEGDDEEGDDEEGNND